MALQCIINYYLKAQYSFCFSIFLFSAKIVPDYRPMLALLQAEGDRLSALIRHFSFASNFLLNVTDFKELKSLLLVQQENRAFFFPQVIRMRIKTFSFCPPPAFLHILEKSCFVDKLKTLITISLVLNAPIE